jgi:N4-gp56 family major capsid protein
MDDGYYVGIIHPAAAATLEADTTWASWNQYTNPQAMYKGEIGRVEGVRFVDSTLCYTTTSGTASSGTTTAYFTYIFGKGAYGVADIDGGIKTYVKNPNQYNTSDPLNQFSSIGYKMTTAAAILNISCGRILVSASSTA